MLAFCCGAWLVMEEAGPDLGPKGTFLPLLQRCSVIVGRGADGASWMLKFMNSFLSVQLQSCGKDERKQTTTLGDSRVSLHCVNRMMKSYSWGGFYG